MLEYRDPFEETENRLNKSALWAITYGDFMSYMMIFFLLLFAFSLDAKTKSSNVEDRLDSIQKAFGGNMSQERLAKLAKKEKEENVAVKLEQAIENEGLKDLADVRMTEEKVMITLKAPVLFESGKADVLPDAKVLLQSLANHLRNVDNPITIEGHTDNIPISNRDFESNWQLSMVRSYNVLKYLAWQGIPPKRLAAVGYGEHRPLGSNATEDGRARNRRIEICLIRSK